MADAGAASGEPAQAAGSAPAGQAAGKIDIHSVPRDKLIDAATGKPIKGKILRPRRRKQMGGKAGLMTIGFKLFAFLFMWGGVKLYRMIFPTMDGSMKMTDAFRSWMLVERGKDVLGVPYLELAKRSGMADEDSEEDADAAPFFQQLEHDWRILENVSQSHGATHRAVYRLLTCIWNKADPCSDDDGKTWKRATVNLRDSGCDYTGSLDLRVSCARSNASTPDLIWPKNQTLSHDLQWTVIGNGAAACFAGTPKTGTLRYINMFGFYGAREGGKCARAEPAAVLQILGVLPAGKGTELTAEEVEYIQNAEHDKKAKAKEAKPKEEKPKGAKPTGAEL